MEYPLEEKIGHPELLVGREDIFKKFHSWIAKMPDRLSKSRVLLGRRKSGKTAFVQRLFNEIWSANGQVIPFYISISDSPIWQLELAVRYYETLISHYISFIEQNPSLINNIWNLEQIKKYSQTKGNQLLLNGVEGMLEYQATKNSGMAWMRAYEAPHALASATNKRILVIIDEFQYLSSHVYRREDLTGDPIEGLPGSFHQVSESKIAPMLVTGSYVGWMIDIMGKYLEAGRLSRFPFSPYLTKQEGIAAVHKYAEVYGEPITNESAIQLNKLCWSDPFFISCVIQSNCPKRDLTKSDGVIEAVNFEIINPYAELTDTWQEYIDRTVDRINEKSGKKILLHLSKHNNREWTPEELKKALNLEEDQQTIHRKLISMVKGDLIADGESNIDFKGLKDGTLNLVLRHHFEKEIKEHQPDLRVDFRTQTEELVRENRKLRGKLNHLIGQTAEYQLANDFRTRKRFQLQEYFRGVTDESKLNIIDARTRHIVQRPDGKKGELDVIAISSDDRVVIVEIRKRQEKSNIEDVEDFYEKAALYQERHSDKSIIPAFLSLGGFTKQALVLCQEKGIVWADELPPTLTNLFQKESS